MSMYYPYKLRCTCGHRFTARLARGVNAQRSPKVKQMILNGTFHRVSCPACLKKMRVEKAFSYTDMGANTFIQVKPRNQYYNWKEASHVLQKKAERLPARLSRAGTRKLRVVYGLAELREKLLCEQHGLNDQVVELIKVVLLHEHRFLLKRPCLQMLLTAVRPAGLEFTASYEGFKRRYRLRLPKSAAEAFARNETALRRWLKKSVKSGEPDPSRSPYMSYRRWLPQTEALTALARTARAVAAGEPLAHTGAAFRHLLRDLPQGRHLPASAKKQLGVLQAYAKKKKLARLQRDLWEVRFGKGMEGEFWKNKSGRDIDTLWRLFEELPDNHIEGNSRIREVSLVKGTGGAYDPSDGEIGIGVDELPRRERLEDTIRHEVGHGVYNQYRKKIVEWLQSEFGWHSFSLTESGLDRWVRAMGGWGKVRPAERREVLRYLRQAFKGKDEWSRGAIRGVDKKHPWRSKGFGPRMAYRGSCSDWYNSNECWHRHGDKAFFLNYYYETLCMVNSNTLDFVNKALDRYAAMSHEEFFAELYALYYDRDDPKRKHIAPPIMSWMKKNLGALKA